MRSCVIEVNYKNSGETRKSLVSLAISTVPVKTVVVDNTPNDPELEVALAPFQDVHLIRAPKNLGFGRGNNLGIDWALRQTDCEFVLILNNDATIKPDAIERMEAAMDAHPEAAIVAARIVLAEDESKLWYGGGEVDWRCGGGRVPGVPGPADAFLAMQARYVSFASGCAMIIRRNVLQELGGFDKRFFMYEEDLELSLRVQEAGWKIWYEPTALISHVGQGSQKKKNKFISRYDSRNPSLVFLVYHGFKNCLLNMGMHAHSWKKIQFMTFFPAFLCVKCAQWVMRGRFDAIRSALTAIRDYRRERRWSHR